METWPLSWIGVRPTGGEEHALLATEDSCTFVIDALKFMSTAILLHILSTVPTRRTSVLLSTFYCHSTEHSTARSIQLKMFLFAVFS